MFRNIVQDKVVIYHGNCLDGFSGAWVAYKKFGNEAFYYGVSCQPNISNDLLLLLQDKEIYFIDVCFAKDIMEQILSNNRKVIIIDHHISQEDIVKLGYEYMFDVSHCASVLAFKYFFPHSKMPKILKYVEDGDLWKWTYKNSHEILAYLAIQEMAFDNWNKIAKDLEDKSKRQIIINNGHTILMYMQSIVKRLIKTADKVIFENEISLAVNSPILNSEIGHELTKNGIHIGIIWSQTGHTIWVSLRGDGTIDVSLIAKKYGGGGHYNAAGFTFKDSDDIPWNLIEK